MAQLVVRKAREKEDGGTIQRVCTAMLSGLANLLEASSRTVSETRGQLNELLPDSAQGGASTARKRRNAQDGTAFTGKVRVAVRTGIQTLETTELLKYLGNNEGEKVEILFEKAANS